MPVIRGRAAPVMNRTATKRPVTAGMEFSSAICLFSLFQGAVNGAGCIAANVTLINAQWFEWTWKWAVMALFEVLSLSFHGSAEENLT
jgi:hypothetical protein